MVPIPALIAISLVAGLVLLWCVRRLVNRRELLAQVNERSSHTVPTPTMGGSAIVLVVLTFLAWLTPELPRLAGGLLLAVALVGLIGLWDDLRNLPAKLRFGTQCVAALIGLWALGISFSILSIVLLVALVWITNLYNFMDGIDGYAAVQTLVFCLGLPLVCGELPGWSGYLLWVLSGVTIAFLAFNWPPAQIFMGDVGSGFLGLLIGLLAIYLWQVNLVSLSVSLILLAGFWVDASYTLAVRIMTGQRFTEAHRSHLYQRLAALKGHTWTTSTFLVFATVWLVPLAWLAVNKPALEWVFLGAAIVPVLLVCWRWRAGIKVAS